MAFLASHADDSCFKHEPWRDTFSSSDTGGFRSDASAEGDLEKLDSHNDDEDEVRINRDAQQSSSSGSSEEHEKHEGSDSADGMSTQTTITTTTSKSRHVSLAPSKLPERVASRMSNSSALTFPEGGLAGWLSVFASFCAMLSIFGLINSSAVFESYFATHQLKDYSSSQIGWIFSLYLFMVFFVGIHVGPIFDKHGPRWLVLCGNLFMVLSLMLLGFCTEYYQILLTYSVLGGLGGALLNSPAYGTIAHHFNRRRGFATGIATTAGGIGGIFFPLIMQRLLPQLGFAWSTRILGFIMLALAVPQNLWIKSRLPPRRDIIIPTTEGKDGSDNEPPPPKTPLRRLAAAAGALLPSFRMFRDPKFAFAAAGIFFMEWGLFIPLTFIVSYAGQATSPEDASNSAYTILSYLNAGSVLGRFLPGFLSDRFGRFNVIIVTIALCCATVLGLWLPARQASPPLTVSFAVLFGFASGSNLGLVPVCLGQLCDSRDFARYMTTANFLASFGTLTSPPIGGALLQLGGERGWMALILFSGLSYGLAFVCYLSSRVLGVGWSVRKIY